jgi:hypothetical protein
VSYSLSNGLNGPNFLLVGAPNTTINTIASVGIAVLFDRNTPFNVTEYIYDTVSSEQGYSVAMSGEVPSDISSCHIIFGGPTNLNTGAVYAYQTQTLSSQKIIPNPNSSESNTQGQVVTLSGNGNILATNYYGLAELTSPPNYIYLYNRTNGIWNSGIQINLPTGLSYQQITSLALSADGKSLIVGTQYSVFLYTYVGSTWTYSKTLNSEIYCTSVAVTPDASIIGYGSNTYNPNNIIDLGCVIIYYTSNATTVTIYDSTAGMNTLQGSSLAISADGSTIAFGGIGYNTNVGAVWVYIYNGTNYIKQQLISPSDIITGSSSGIQIGYSVAISSDGNTLAFGGPYDNNGIGAVWVYTRTNNIWTEQQKISSYDVIPFNNTCYQGFSVSLSADGNTLVYGGPQDNYAAGAVWVYTRANSVWSEQSKIVPSSATNYSIVGTDVALCADGSTLAIGAPGTVYNYRTGTVYVYI